MVGGKGSNCSVIRLGHRLPNVALRRKQDGWVAFPGKTNCDMDQGQFTTFRALEDARSNFTRAMFLVRSVLVDDN